MSKEKQPAAKGAETSNATAKQPSPVSLNGAAIIDENGREIPITESMIIEAFGEIENSGKSQ